MILTITPADTRIEVSAEKTLLDNCLAHDLPLAYSCRDGRCEQCRCQLLSGTVVDRQGDPVSGTAAGRDILGCQVRPRTDVVIRAEIHAALAGIPVQTLPAKVAALAFPVADIAVLTLRLPPGRPFRFVPGQYVRLTCRGVTRSYSIAGHDPQRNQLVFHVKCYPDGAMSRQLRELAQDDRLTLHGPEGTFYLRDHRRPVVFAATGTGIAPILPMLEQLASWPDKPRIYLFWSVQSPGAFHASLAPLGDKIRELHYVPLITRPDPGWTGATGYIEQALADHVPDIASAVVYACGAPAMINAVRDYATTAGLAGEHFHSDAYLAS